MSVASISPENIKSGPLLCLMKRFYTVNIVFNLRLEVQNRSWYSKWPLYEKDHCA